VLFFALLVAFGALVERRTAFMERRMGDMAAYLRPAWAVRVGLDIYEVTDHNGWHYNYPPLFAILMTPLADAPPGHDRGGLLPFAASVAIWYVLSVVFLAVGAHWLAAALERSSPDPAVRSQPAFCRRWWALRLVPVLACLVPVGHSLMRNQVNPLVLLLLCGMMAAMLRGQSWRAGLFLAVAICIKVIPAFLLLYPLWRRDGRCLAGCAAGLVMGLLVIPAGVFGLPRTLDYYRQYAEVTLGPGAGLGNDQSRAHELTQIKSTDSQSIMAMLHGALHPDRASRPGNPTPAVRLVHLIVCGLLTLAVLAAEVRSSRQRRPEPGPHAVLFPATLVVIMLLASPVCHLHYFVLTVPLVMALVERAWRRHGAFRLGTLLTVLLAVNMAGMVLPNLPGLLVLRDLGVAGWATLALWLAGVAALGRREEPEREERPASRAA
jgi:hypothetical protein